MATADFNDGRIFVFGSNLSGIHGAGAARFAYDHRGAVLGIGKGLTGQSYALPTKDKKVRTLPLKTVEKYVKEFLKFAAEHPELRFEVTKVGCGLAGFTEEQIAPMFARAPLNCDLPDGWRKQCGIVDSP